MGTFKGDKRGKGPLSRGHTDPNFWASKDDQKKFKITKKVLTKKLEDSIVSQRKIFIQCGGICPDCKGTPPSGRTCITCGKESIRDPAYLLVHLVEMIRSGYRTQAVASIRTRGRTVAWAEAAVSAIEWAINERTLEGEKGL